MYQNFQSSKGPLKSPVSKMGEKRGGGGGTCSSRQSRQWISSYEETTLNRSPYSGR